MMRLLRLAPAVVASSFAAAVTLAPATADAAIIATRKTSTPWPGVQTIEGRTKAPANDYHAVVVSLCTAGVRVDATKAPSSLTTVPAFAAATGAEVAVNGDFFTTGPRVYGLAVGGGAAWPRAKTGVDPAVKSEWYYERFGWIALGPSWVEFAHTESVKKNAAALGVTEGWKPTEVAHDFPKGTVALVSGFPELVTEGKRVTCASPTADSCFAERADMRLRNPRTAMGLSRDRRKLVLVVVDGRKTSSPGMYGTELAELVEELGAWQAFNLDGGGSTEMWIRGQGTVNDPSDGASRRVANHWGVFVEAGKAAAHCSPPSVGDGGLDDAGEPGGATGSEATDDGGRSAAAPGGPAGGEPEAEPGAGSGGEGCAQGEGKTSPPGAAAFALGALGLAGYVRTRRRRDAPSARGPRPRSRRRSRA